jgi:hypothetical protein
MREIKYKAWVMRDIDYGLGWLDDGLLRVGWLKGQCRWYQLPGHGTELMWGFDECEEPLVVGEEPLVVGKDVEIVFFTGLHDKNGKEIYEGDICEWYIHKEIWRGEVYFDTEASAFLFCRASQWSIMEIHAPKIIGNIHESPELLK